MRSAPKSGKTSLLQLLKTEILKTRKGPAVYYVPCHEIDVNGGETLASYLERKFNKSWKYFLSDGELRLDLLFYQLSPCLRGNFDACMQY